jgi:hypothetical protein
MPAASLISNGLSRRSVLFSALGAIQHNSQVVLLSGIEFQHLANGSSTRRFLRIHGNEETARETLEKVIAQTAGEAYIVTSKTRMVRIAGATLDPNRMFSRPGAEKSLLANNPDMPPPKLSQILDWLDAERPKLLAPLLPPPGGVLIALHNNGPGYSVDTERPISQAESLPRPSEPHEFFLATSRSDFAILARGPYNAVLQNEPAGPDDGSLSRLCARQGIRYVNLEVAHGKLETQIQMLQWLITALP